MAHLFPSEYRLRVDFSSKKNRFGLPNLLETQIDSYKRFLQADLSPEERLNTGLEAIFRQFFNVEDEKGSWSLKYLGYTIEKPGYSVKDCLERSLNYAGAMQVNLRLNIWNMDPVKGKRIGLKTAKEQKVYINEIPFITDNGSFVMNGVERVFVMQLHRSPGVIFKRLKPAETGEDLFSAQIIPEHGSWIEFETTRKNSCYIKIDKKKRFPATLFLNALGYSNYDILKRFYPIITVRKEDHFLAKGDLNGLILDDDLIIDDKTMGKSGSVITRQLIKSSEGKVEYFPVVAESLYGACFLNDIVVDDEIVIAEGDTVTPDNIVMIPDDYKEFEIALIQGRKNIVYNSIKTSIQLMDKLGKAVGQDIDYSDLAGLYIYHNQRPGEPASTLESNQFINNLFFEGPSYDLSVYGRVKINKRLGIQDMTSTHIMKNDIVKIIEYLVLLINGKGFLDDIDSLSNRRIRRIGEMLGAQIKSAMLSMQKGIKDKMGFLEAEKVSPLMLVNANIFASVFRSFFESNQLSQFLDQINPLAEVSHKRRISSLGAGGLTRERAGFEVRDVNPSHYGRICLIETPEGPNIGLIVSLANYARVNKYGFIETPYRKVSNGILTGEIEYLTFDDEHNKVICTAKSLIDKNGKIIQKSEARRGDDIILSIPEEIDYMDISPKQLLGVSASCIPFIEHDDANRALMGSNMQRQAVPLIKPRSCAVGTGMEGFVAKNSGRMILARHDGKVVYVDSTTIIIEIAVKNGALDVFDIDIYKLNQYMKTNQNTVFVNMPIVRKNDLVKKGQAIADGPSTDKGELALGHDLTVAFMPWRGYNYEDAITISERVVKEDLLSSVHMETFECTERDTKLGPEEFTADVPNNSKEILNNLDESGIIRVGAYVKPGDILVGKVTPRVAANYSPEEKLFQAIFGEKAKNVSDSSLKVPPGIRGIVTDVKVFVRRGVEKGDKRLELERYEKKRESELLDRKNEILHHLAALSLLSALNGSTTPSSIHDKETVFVKANEIIKKEKISGLSYHKLCHISTIDDSVNNRIKSIIAYYNKLILNAEAAYERNSSAISNSEDLSTGVLRIAKITLAIKRHLEVGDKLAGRHGNKGVVSRMLPVEDLPFMEDGKPVDIVLNPLGVPSRMNAGQILEAHLGIAAKGIGKLINKALEQYNLSNLRKIMLSAVPFHDDDTEKFINSLSDEQLLMYADDWRDGAFMATEAFESATENDIDQIMKAAGIPAGGRYTLFDGLTGEAFDMKVMVGSMHIIKLNHMVEDKVHARSVGPYSLVTQQPLGGKAQFGGQRFGEMEVWALEGYGAAYNLWEVLTLKSDDIEGRSRAYEAIVKGRPVPLGGIPESFNVLVKELQSLGLSIELLKETR